MEGEKEEGAQAMREADEDTEPDSVPPPSSHLTESSRQHQDERINEPSTSQVIPQEFSDDEPQESGKQPQSTHIKDSSSRPRGESFSEPSNKSFRRELDNSLLLSLTAIAVAAFAIGIPVGYAIRGECGQGRFDNIDATLQKFLTETVKHNVEKTLEDVNIDFKSLLSDHRTNLETLKTSLDDSDRSVKTSTSEISQAMVTLNHAMKNMNDQMTSLETKINDMESTLKTVTNDIKSSQKQLGQSATDFTTESAAAVAKIKESSGETTRTISETAKDTIKKIKSQSSEYNTQLQSSATGVEDIVMDVGEKMQDLRSAVGKVSEQQAELTRVVGETVNTGRDLKTAKTELEGQVGNLKKWESKLCADGKAEAKQDYVGYGLDIIQLVMLVILYKAVTESRRDNAGISAAPQGVMPARQPQRVSPALGAGPGPRRLPPTGPVRYEVTVVTFTQETFDQARRVFPEMLGEAWPPPGKVEYKMLTGELDLSQIPSSRGYIVVIGYDARNSILEDMDGSMGSRKRQTIVGLQNTKRDVLVIYIDSDHQIDEPPENALYNTHLDRPTSHPILRPLVDAQRFLSLRHWRGTRLQAAHLKKWLRAL